MFAGLVISYGRSVPLHAYYHNRDISVVGFPDNVFCLQDLSPLAESERGTKSPTSS